MKQRILLSAVLAIVGGVFAHAESQADAIMRVSYDLPQPATLQATMYMLLVDRGGSQNLRVLSTYRKKVEGGTDSYTVFLSPPDVKGTKFLSLATKEGEDVQRIWLPELRRVRRIAGGSKGDTFVGSDLTYYDMSTHRFSDATYALHGADTLQVVQDGVKNEVPCWVVDSVPRDQSVPYGKTRVWVGKQDSFIYRSTMWDKNGNELKTVYILEVANRDGIIVPIKTGVVTNGGHKTLLQMSDVVLNEPIDPALFTIANLQR